LPFFGEQGKIQEKRIRHKELTVFLAIADNEDARIWEIVPG
jgi:hypothetical protein